MSAADDLLAGAEAADRHGRLAPAPDVLVAIALAVEECWPRHAPPVPVAARWNGVGAPWRFSGRWWAHPAPRRRDRPVL